MEPLSLARTIGFENTVRAQCGLIRKDQAAALGYSDASISAEVRAGRWLRVLPRVFLVGGWHPGPAGRVMAVWLWAGLGAVIAGSAAAWWQGLHTAFPAVIDVLVPPRRRMSPQPIVRVIRASISEPDWAWCDGIRVTAAARTCLDLVRQGGGELLDDALRSGRLRVDQLPGSLARSWHRRGQVRARAVVGQVSGSPWSLPERRAHAALREAGITGWVANQRARSVSGTVYPDIGFGDVMLAIEIDGRGTHDPALAAEAFEAGHERELALVAAGWTVVRFTVRQIIEQPEMFVRIVREVLARLSAGQAQ